LTEKDKPKFFYGYVIVLIGLCVQILAWGTFSTFGVFFNSFLSEFGWARATISGAASLAFLLMGMLSIVAGKVGDRFGPRIGMTGCGIFFGLGYLLMSQVGAIWQLYLFYGLIVAVGLSGMDVLPLSTVARWFVKRRGLMSGILKVGSGAGMVIMPLVASWFISSYGWRTSYLILGSVIFTFIVVAAQFLRRDPGERGLVPYGAEEVGGDSLNSGEEGFSLREVIRIKQFWMFCTAFAFINVCVQTVIVHIVPHGVDVGLSVANAASVLAILGGVSMAGRVVMGIVGDRIGNRLAITICFPIIAIALFWLQMAEEWWMLCLFAIVYGFAHGGIFALLSPLVAELFGLKEHGVIFGLIIFNGALGGCLGPVLVGYSFDITGSYQIGFLVCALLAVASFIISLRLRPTTDKDLRHGGGILGCD